MARFLTAAALLALSVGVSAFRPPVLPPPFGTTLRRRGATRLAGVSMLDEIGSTASFPRLPPMDLESDQRVRLAQILQKSTVFDLLSAQVTDAIQDIALHLGRDVESALVRIRTQKAREDVQAAGAGEKKKKLVVLGSGWGAHALVKIIDTDKFDVVAISPRPYFIFTPMLAASSVGTVEYRSISEPMRASNPFVDYIQAEATGVDTAAKKISCRSSQLPGERFSVSYDYLVVSVGVQSADFGVPGVP